MTMLNCQIVLKWSFLMWLVFAHGENHDTANDGDCLLYIFNVSGEYKDYTFDYDDMAG